MMLSSQCYLKSGLLTQSFGQEDSRKLINIISSHCLLVFKKYLNRQTSFETARDTVRHELYSQNPAQFPYGTRGTSVVALTSAILAPDECVAISSLEHTSCEYSEPTMNDRLEFILCEKEDLPLIGYPH